MHARYLAGCDGGNSAVRKLCGESFHGEDPVARWVVADVQLDNPPAPGEGLGRNLRIGTYQVSSVEQGWFRVSMMKVIPPVDRSAPVTLDELRQTMIDGIGTDFGLRTARWMSRFGDGFRQVGKYRYQRVFLLGDAAHTHSPIGGQCLNLGIQDAMNLGWKMGLVVSRKSPQTLLDTFEGERHLIGAMVLKMAKAQTALIKPGPQIEALRQVVGQMLSTPEVTMQLPKILSGLGVHYHWGEGCHPLVGQRFPNLSLDHNNGSVDLFSLMSGGRSLLLNFAGSEKIELPETCQSLVDVIDCVAMVKVSRQVWTLPVIGEVPALKRAFIRPHGFTTWTQSIDEAYDAGSLSNAMHTWLG